MAGTVVVIRYKKQEDLASNLDLMKAYAAEEHGKINTEEPRPKGFGINDEPIEVLEVWFVTLWSALWFLTKAVSSQLMDIYDVRLIGDGPEYDRQAVEYAKRG